MSKCKECLEITKFVTNECVKEGTCEAGTLVITAAFAAADIIFVEADEILVPLEVAFDVTWEVVCNKMGFNWIKNHVDEFAEEVCKKAKFC